MNLEKALGIIDRFYASVASGKTPDGMSSPTRAAFQLIRQNRPQTRQDFEKLFKLKYVGKGCSRVAYQIEGTKLVVKFEDEDRNENTKREVECFEILRRHRQSLPYLMQILYHVPGIIVVPLYKKAEADARSVRARDTMTQLFGMAGVTTCDLHHNNIMEDERGNIRCTDMGHFYFIKKEELA